MIRRVQVSVFAVLLLLATSAFGATRYVTDELRISLRSGAGNQYRIVRVIPSGTALEALETAGEWARVRAGEEEGWVRTQYLTAQPIAADRLDEAQAQLAAARERVSELEGALRQTREELDATRSQANELTATNENLQQQVAAAEEGLQLSEENTRLREQSSALKVRIDELESEISHLTGRSEREWFAVGAGVLFAGLLSGIIVTRIPWRRRNRMFE